MATFDPPPFSPQRAATLQAQPSTTWDRLRTDDLLVDAAFIIAHDLSLTPESRSTWPARCAAAATNLPRPTAP